MGNALVVGAGYIYYHTEGGVIKLDYGVTERVGIGLVVGAGYIYTHTEGGRVMYYLQPI